MMKPSTPKAASGQSCRRAARQSRMREQHSARRDVPARPPGDAARLLDVGAQAVEVRCGVGELGEELEPLAGQRLGVAEAQAGLVVTEHLVQARSVVERADGETGSV